jgi:hypothetical protein
MRMVPLKRSAVMAGLISVAVAGAALLMPAAARADVHNPPHGSTPGALRISPATGTGDTVPNWSTTVGCPAGHNAAGAFLTGYANDNTAQQISGNVNPFPADAPISSTPMLGSMSAILSILLPTKSPETFEFAVQCEASSADFIPVMSEFVTFQADGSYTTSDSPPSGPTATTTTLTPSTTTVGDGGIVTFTATVAPAAAAGHVNFLDGTTPLPGSPVTVTGGTAQLAAPLSGQRAHNITASFVPDDTTKFGASSGTTSVTVTGGNVQTETINVSVPQSEGPFIMTVSGTPVSLGTAALSSDFTKFTASGTLGDVTISDERNQSVPGWSISGAVGDFRTSGNTHSFPGRDLGWTPSVKTQNPAGDVVAGSAVTPGTNPGLSAASGLASAGAGHGLHTSVLSAILSLVIPSSTAAGDYTATMTITAIP